MLPADPLHNKEPTLRVIVEKGGHYLHRHRRANIAMNLALTRNALLVIIPFNEKKNLPALVEEYRDHKQLAINLVLNAHPFP